MTQSANLSFLFCFWNKNQTHIPTPGASDEQFSSDFFVFSSFLFFLYFSVNLFQKWKLTFYTQTFSCTCVPELINVWAVWIKNWCMICDELLKMSTLTFDLHFNLETAFRGKMLLTTHPIIFIHSSFSTSIINIFHGCEHHAHYLQLHNRFKNTLSTARCS